MGNKKILKRKNEKKYDTSKGQLVHGENKDMFYLLKLAITCTRKLGEYLVIWRALGHLRHSLTQTLKALM